MTDQAPFIHIRQLSKNYAGPLETVEVLKELDLEVARGESVAIVGASGVGKSTLLHILGTLDRPTGGEVLWEGADLFGRDERSLAAFRNENIGFVFQFHHLLPEFSALENVMMPLLVARCGREEARRRGRELLAQVGLSQREGHRPGELSGGEQQRVAVARALARAPKLLLADEPTGNLDERTGDKVHELLIRLNREMGLTTLVATHNMKLAAALGRRVSLAEGRVWPA